MEQKLDLRIQKTYLPVTKALIEMMEEMPFENIKVKELCDRAMIRMSTFYKHFADKYELLAFIVKEVITDYNERIRSDSLVLLLNILSQQVTPDICQKLKQDQARGRRMPASPEVMATFFAGGISESLRSWFTGGKKRSEEDIKKQLSDIIRWKTYRNQRNDSL